MREIPEEWKPLSFPEEVGYLYEWFVGMRKQNGDDFSSQAMKSWFDLRGIKPVANEVQTLNELMTALRETQEKMMRSVSDGEAGTTGGQPPNQNSRKGSRAARKPR